MRTYLLEKSRVVFQVLSPRSERQGAAGLGGLTLPCILFRPVEKETTTYSTSSAPHRIYPSSEASD